MFNKAMNLDFKKRRLKRWPMKIEYPVSSFLVLLSLGIWLYWPWANWYLYDQPLVHGMVDGKYTLLQSKKDLFAITAFYSIMGIAFLLFIVSVGWFSRLNIGKVKYISVLSSALYIGYGLWIISPKYL